MFLNQIINVKIMQTVYSPGCKNARQDCIQPIFCISKLTVDKKKKSERLSIVQFAIERYVCLIQKIDQPQDHRRPWHLLHLVLEFLFDPKIVSRPIPITPLYHPSSGGIEAERKRREADSRIWKRVTQRGLKNHPSFLQMEIVKINGKKAIRNIYI